MSYYSTNRSAVLVTGTDKLREWTQKVNGVAPTMDFILTNVGVYLIEARVTKSRVKQELQDQFQEIFSNELNDINSNRDLWPDVTSFDVFCEFYNYILMCSTWFNSTNPKFLRFCNG